MTTPSINEILNYADLQMAEEVSIHIEVCHLVFII